MERRQRELLEAQETIRRLEEQLRQLQKAKEELEVSQKELHSMMKRLEEAKEMEMVEKIKLEEEIRAKQEEVQRIADEVQRKDEETRRLQVIPLSHLIIYKSANWILIILNNWIIFFMLRMKLKRPESAKKRPLLRWSLLRPRHSINMSPRVIRYYLDLVATVRCQYIIFFLYEQDEGDDDETPNGDVSGGRDLISESEMETSIRDPVEDRQTLAEKNERLQTQLKVRLLKIFTIRISICILSDALKSTVELLNILMCSSSTSTFSDA